MRSFLLRCAASLSESLGELERILLALNRDRAVRYGIPGSQVQGLLRLVQEGPMTVSALGDRMYLDKSTASRLAKALLKAGLVRKRSPASDDRRVILQLTERGMRLSRRILNDRSEEWMEILARLDPETQHELPTGLGRLVRELQRREEEKGVSGDS
jgi:DNA-binding MarR family transcriptional regulator